jgi:hypothetical protein
MAAKLRRPDREAGRPPLTPSGDEYAAGIKERCRFRRFPEPADDTTKKVSTLQEPGV